MLHVSAAVMAAEILLLAVCFLLPVALYFFLVKYGECESKPLIVGALSYFIGGFILDTALLNILYYFTDVAANRPVYFLYTLLLSPAILLVSAFLAIKLFGKKMLTTGDALMFATGYAGLQNLILAGVNQLRVFIEMLNINKTGSFVVVSDSDYVSYTDVKAGNIVPESSYKYLEQICSFSVSDILLLSLDRILMLTAYAAIIYVIWLGMSRQGGIVLLAAAYGMRLVLAVPSIMSDMGWISARWLILLLALVVTAAEWTAAIMVRRQYIDLPIVNDTENPEE